MIRLPRSWVWEVTSRCNSSCAHCYNVWTAPGADPLEDLSSSKMLRVVRTLEEQARRAVRLLTFTGGEPLLRGDLEDLTAAARRALPRAQLTLASNGQLLPWRVPGRAPADGRTDLRRRLTDSPALRNHLR